MGIHPQPYDPLTITGASSYSNPDWLTALAASKITGTFMKSQQHAQTPYKDEANTWAETQIFQKPITVQDGYGNNVFDVVTNQIRFRSASAGYLVGPSGQCLAGEDVGGFYYGMGFTTPSKPIYIGQALTTQLIPNAQVINNRTSEFNILGVDGTGLGALRAGVTTFGTGTAYGQLNVYGGATYIAQDQPINWHSGGTIRSQIIGDSTDNLRFSTRKAGVLTEAFVLAGSGAATFNGTVNLTNSNRVNYGSNSFHFQYDGDLFAETDGDFVLREYTSGIERLRITTTGAATFNGSVTSTSTGKLGDFTVATLPSAASNAGYEANVTDSSVTTFGSTVAGSGSSRVKVYSNGTNWTVQAV